MCSVGYRFTRVDKTTHPGDEITHPSDKITHPGDKITHPGDNITHPGDNLTHPGDNLTHPLKANISGDFLPKRGGGHTHREWWLWKGLVGDFSVDTLLDVFVQL